MEEIYPSHVLVVAAVELGLGHLRLLPLLPTVPGNLAHRLHSLKVAGHIDRLIVTPRNNGGISCVSSPELAFLQFFDRLLLVGQRDVIEPDSLHCFKFTGKFQQIDCRVAVQTVNGRFFSGAIFPVDGLRNSGRIQLIKLLEFSSPSTRKFQ